MMTAVSDIRHWIFCQVKFCWRCWSIQRWIGFLGLFYRLIRAIVALMCVSVCRSSRFRRFPLIPPWLQQICLPFQRWNESWDRRNHLPFEWQMRKSLWSDPCVVLVWDGANQAVIIFDWIDAGRDLMESLLMRWITPSESNWSSSDRIATRYGSLQFNSKSMAFSVE